LRSAAAQVLDHARRWRAVVHEAALHAGHHEPVAQRQAADRARREQDVEIVCGHRRP
jgi:hypothetical protein